MSEYMHSSDLGWVIDGKYVCIACCVREPWEHRCHGNDGPVPCTCSQCREEDSMNWEHPIDNF